MTCFHEGIGVCEQITSIPIPVSYTRLTSRFLVLWHLTLPIILWDDCHWIVVPATFISAASLFCIEEVCFIVCFSLKALTFEVKPSIFQTSVSIQILNLFPKSIEKNMGL